MAFSREAVVFRKDLFLGQPDYTPHMPVLVRPMHDDEARSFLEIHGRSVRGLAAEHYPADVIAAWAGPVTVTDNAVHNFLKNSDHEIRLIAEIDGQPVGLGGPKEWYGVGILFDFTGDTSYPVLTRYRVRFAQRYSDVVKSLV